MSEIKLPVTVEEDANLFRENARSMWILREADGREIIRSAQQNVLQRIAAALNAAPKRAFAELTADGVGLILQNVLLEIGEPPEGLFDRTDWLMRHDATVLAHLQAFAAPGTQGGREDV
jgi:hypothetical protein